MPDIRFNRLPDAHLHEYITFRRKNESVSNFLGAVEMNGSNQELMEAYDSAISAYSSGDYRKAADCFKAVTCLTPDDWNAQFYLAMSLAQDLQTKPAHLQFLNISQWCPDASLRQRANSAARSLQMFLS